ncbi:MAG: hypothetical protein V1870_04190, partial [Candidatus Aenigmatarchaeota archaeon]
MELNDWIGCIKKIDQRFENYRAKAVKIGLHDPLDLPDSSIWYDALSELKYKTIAVAGNPADVCVGGLCVVYTGDLNKINTGYLPDGTKIENEKHLIKWLGQLPRLDQIVETIGPTSAKKYVVVYEDSLFANLIAEHTGLDEKILQPAMKNVSEKTAKMIENWLSLTTGSSLLTNVYTSDIEEYLKKYVALLSEDSGKPLTRNLNKVDQPE